MIDLLTMYHAQPNSPHTTTLGEISATDTSVAVADVSVLPSTVPFLLTLGFDKNASETVLVTAVSGGTLTIVRGVDGSAFMWVAGTKVARVLTAKDINDIQSNILRLNSDKQDTLTFDDAPTEGSDNVVSSGAIFDALEDKAGAEDLDSHTDDTDIHVTAQQKQNWDGKQNAISGANGQIVGFDAGGHPIAVDAPIVADAFEVVLTVNGWNNNEQNVANAKLKASGFVYVVSPVFSSFTAYCEANIHAKEITDDGVITFVAGEVPSAALTVTILKMEVQNG